MLSNLRLFRKNKYTHIICIELSLALSQYVENKFGIGEVGTRFAEVVTVMDVLRTATDLSFLT